MKFSNSNYKELTEQAWITKIWKQELNSSSGSSLIDFAKHLERSKIYVGTKASILLEVSWNFCK